LADDKQLSPASSATSGKLSPDVQAGRRRRRVQAIGVILVVCLIGNVAGWFGWPTWGPIQNDPKLRLWVYVSAAVFWLAVAMLLVCLRDLTSMLSHHGERPPTHDDLQDDSGIIGAPAKKIRPWVAKYQAAIGAIALVIGAIAGHYFWKP
jgi:hypothetical protein